MTWPPPRLSPAGVTLMAACLLVGCSVPEFGGRSPSPSPSAAAPVTAVVDTPGNSTPLRLRSTPATDGKILAELKKGTQVVITCKVEGQRISGTQGPSSQWNRVTHKTKTGYLSAAFLKGGTDPAIGVCPTETPTPGATSSASPDGRGAVMDERIVSIARSQLGKKERRSNCNPYGGCMPWDSLFATWVWRRAGDTVPVYSFSGDLYRWAKRFDRMHRGVEGVGIGDLVLYGSGPSSKGTSRHVDIVVGVFPDHLRVIGGDVNNKVSIRNVPLKGIYAWVDA